MTAQTTESSTKGPLPLYTEEKAERLCNKWVKSGLTGNTTIKMLIEQLESLGCAPLEGNFINCLYCERPNGGFFGRVVEEPVKNKSDGITKDNAGDLAAPSSNCGAIQTTLAAMLEREAKGETRLKIIPEIYVCQQYMSSESHTHKTLVHELVHAIDQCRTRMDPLHNCLHIACTEVRAENLSGECSFWREIPRMISNGTFSGHKRECVRRRALLSVQGNPNCRDRAEQYVDAVLNRCLDDIYPFDRHPGHR